LIDLHIHSTYSDGTYTVKEILQEAEKKRLEIISITDHDTIQAYEELAKLDVKSYYTGEIIVGCELECIYQNTPIEILGYNLNIEELKKSTCLGNLKDTYLRIQQQYLEQIKKVAKQIGLVFQSQLNISMQKLEYASDVFQKEIERYPENEEILKQHQISLKPNFYRAQQCNPNSIFYINEKDNFPKVEDLVEQIHKANGLAFLAHPYIYPFKKTEQTVKEMIIKGIIDGLECYYSYFTKEQTEKLLDLCKKYHLYASGGTDFHGEKRPEVQMGSGTGNLKIAKEVVDNWVYYNKIEGVNQ